MWNCAGFRASATSTSSKFSFLSSQLSTTNFAIAAIIESHHKDSQDFCQDLGQYDQTHTIINSPVLNETHAGIILLINKNFEIISQSEVIPGRLLNAQLKHSNSTINLTVFYGHQWAKMKKEDITNTFRYFDNMHEADGRNMIIGDFNFVDQDVDKGKNMDQRDKMIFPIWETFLSENNMIDPFRQQCPKKKLFSFIGPQGKSRGDRLYTSEEISRSIKNFRYITTPFNGAHKIMTFDWQSEQQIGPSSWKINSSIINDDHFAVEIEKVFAELNDLDIPNPIDWWDIFITVVQGTSMSYSKKKNRIKKSLKAFLITQIESLETFDEEKMSQNLLNKYHYYKNRLNEIIKYEIRGHEIRTRGQPKYEINEPNISTYSKFEKQYQTKNTFYHMKDKHGKILTGNKNLLHIAEDYYTKLFKNSKTNITKQNELLQKVSKKLSDKNRDKLDAQLTLEELDPAVMSLPNNKSPGLDGITAEFYKKFWYLIRKRYLAYINAAKVSGFTSYRNRSSTTLVYKNKGEIYDLDYYRPIALINVDIKILTKALSNRLRPVLETIIHHSQTAVDRRKIDYTVHMVRDLIDLINKEDTEGALIFLDQEKAFDRVEHDFLFKVLRAFGIGNSFIDWLKIIYANASTVIKVNGFFTNPIALKRGLRQGCPLSPSLYVMVIEILAIQLRTNQNIVGFVVEGEKIISLHYADDATIVIKQNRCFKEVIKEIEDYEVASGSKVNYEKTKGLWLGRWKDRTDTPWGITWTNKNLKNLGIYFGNEDPAQATFRDIIPKVKRSMNFWKQFKLCKFAKARVIEIFHASRLWYAINFYPLPAGMKRELQNAFREYVNFPRQPTISENELKKLRLHGGIKLIDIQVKLETYRSMWLIDLTIKPSLKTHLAVMTSLVGVQKGGLYGKELFFVDEHYSKRLFKSPHSAFYMEAIKSTAKLSMSKKIVDLSTEKMFYNPIFRGRHLRTLPIPKICERQGTVTYGDVVDEYTKQINGQPCKLFLANIYPKITHFDIVGKTQNTIFISEMQSRVTLQVVSCKDVYGELLQLTYRDHHSMTKWEDKFPDYLFQWPKIWASVNNPITTEVVKTLIWEQIHLNNHCTYSYNKWHNQQEKCPLCLTIPSSIYHLTLECAVTNSLWDELEPHLMGIINQGVSDEEKAFGLMGDSPNIILRNWVTFILRKCISDQENIAYHNGKGPANIKDIKVNFNDRIHSELMKKYNIFKHLDRLLYFENFFAVNNYLIAWEDDWWQVLTLFKV